MSDLELLPATNTLRKGSKVKHLAISVPFKTHTAQVSIVEPVHPEKDSPDLQGVSAAAGDGQNRRKTDAPWQGSQCNAV